MILNRDTRALSKLLDHVGDLSGESKVLKVVVHLGVEHDSSQGISGTGDIIALDELVLEDLLNLKPSFFNLNVSEHDASLLEVGSQLVAVKLLDVSLQFLVELLLENSSDGLVVWVALVVYELVLVVLGGEFQAVELFFDVLLDIDEILESLLININQGDLCEWSSE